MLRPITGALCALWLLALASAASAEIITIVATEPIIDFPNSICGCTDPAPGAGTLPAELPFAVFDFNGQPTLESLTGIEISLTMDDGDTGVGDFDFDQLSLKLGSSPTGIQLNGFDDGTEKSLSFSVTDQNPNWPGSTVMTNLLSELYGESTLPGTTLVVGEGQLFASIADASPGDNFVNLYSAFDTTLKLTGKMLGGTGNAVPEPASVLAWGLVLGGLFWQRRRRRQQ